MLSAYPNEAALASVNTGFDTTPATVAVSPAPAPATVETGFGDPGGTPAPLQQASCAGAARRGPSNHKQQFGPFKLTGAA
jgi:hypothetical protein